jgi:hypothetical protein
MASTFTHSCVAKAHRYFTKWPDLCNDFCEFAAHIARSEPQAAGGRWKNVMNQHSNGKFGLIIGGVVAVIAAMFILTGGELGGKKTVEGDQDLPPVASDSAK